MKLKAIATIFKRFKFLRIWDTPSGSQWITNGAAVYSMEGMPKLSPATLLKIFDIPEDKQSEWTCKAEPMPADIYKICADYRIVKTPLDQKETTFQWKGTTYVLLCGSNGEIVPIDGKYIKPLEDEMDYLRFFKCNLKNGVAVLCYDGLETKAVIMPVGVGGVLARELLEIGKYFSSQSYCAIAEDTTDLMPLAMNVDPETGEILDASSDYEQETLEGGADNG